MHIQLLCVCKSRLTQVTVRIDSNGALAGQPGLELSCPRFFVFFRFPFGLHAKLLVVICVPLALDKNKHTHLHRHTHIHTHTRAHARVNTFSDMLMPTRRHTFVHVHSRARTGTPAQERTCALARTGVCACGCRRACVHAVVPARKRARRQASTDTPTPAHVRPHVLARA